MATSGQTLNDRINAARYALAGQGLARCVCKATTEEVIGPKKKHLDYLLACTHEPNVSIPQLANLLIERTNHIQWVVVFKALVTVHHLMSYGNERFIQYLASSNYSFELSTFLDKTSARDFSMSTFIRRYSRYINEKALSYRLLAFDFCKIKRGNEGVLRLMPIDRLLKTLPILQNQLDALLEFDCSASDLNNGVINACFMLLFRDLIGLFACHNDGIINLLNKYFTLNKKMCREAFDLYKKFLVRMDKVSDFLRVAEVVGIEKDEIPDLRRAPSSLIDALEQHLQNLESKKGNFKSSNLSTSSISNKSGNELRLGSVTPPSSLARSSSPSNPTKSSGTSGTSSGTEDLALSNFKDDEVRRALEEEARVLSLYGSGETGKSSKSSPGQIKIKSSSEQDDSSLKFAVSTTPKTINDIFGDSDSFAANSSNNSNGFGTNDVFESNNNTNADTIKQVSHPKPDFNSIKMAIQSATTTLEKSNNSGSIISDSKPGPKKASDDLFSLLDTSSPNAVAGESTSHPAQTLSTNQSNPISPFATNSTPFDLPTNGNRIGAVMPSSNPFPSTATNSLFKPTGADYTSLGPIEGFGHVLQPMSSGGRAATSQLSNKPSFASSGMPSTGLFKGDLDSTLANLAQNLTFEGLKPKK